MVSFTSFMTGRFAFNTPYTPGGKAHGDVTEQHMRKTILTSMECFPYVKRRSKVVKQETVRKLMMCTDYLGFPLN